MGLLSINKTIQKQLDEGKSREDIFSELTAESPADTVKFAYCLASTPYRERRQKYLKYNALLFLLLIGLAGLSLAAEWPVDFQQSTLFIAIKFFVPLVFSYFVFNFHGGIYRLVGIWCLIDLAESLLLLGFATGAGLAKIVVLSAIVVLSFFIARRVFPNLGLLGPRQDSEGRYLL